jgi:tetratricopeptide (TPR) repeat protein
MISIVFLGMALYASTLGSDFIYNDYEMVADNTFVTSWKNLDVFFDGGYFTGSREATYRPVVTLSFFVDYALWGHNPAGYHLTNLVFHMANGILLYWLVILFMGSREVPDKASGKPRSPIGITLPLLAALLFVSHPIVTEGVNSIGSRHEALSLFFYLSSVCIYLKANSFDNAKAWLFYTVSAFAALLSMLSLELGVTILAIIVLMDLFPFDGRADGMKKKMEKFIRRVPVYALYAGMTGFYLYLRFVKIVHPVSSLNDFFDAKNFLGGTYLTNFATSMTILKDYIFLMFFPVRLSLEYIVHPVNGLLDPNALFSLALVAVVALIAVLSREKRPLIFFGWAWFFITVLPVSNAIIPLVVIRMSERFLYLPAAGFCIFLAAVLVEFQSRGVKGMAPQVLRRITAAAVIVLLCLYSARTVMRNLDWRDSLTFWRTAARTESGSFRTHNNLAMQYYYGGEKDKALEELKISLNLLESAQTRVNLGFVFFEMGDLEKAEAEFAKAIKDDPLYAPAYYHMALIAASHGRDEEAISLLEDAALKYTSLKERPFEAETHYHLGRMLSQKGLKVRAAEEYGKALAAKADFSAARYELAGIYVDAGDYGRAAEELEKVVLSDPENSGATMLLGYAYSRQGLDHKAAEMYANAVKATPDDLKMRYVLANLYLKIGLLDRAEKEYTEILARDPKNADSMNNLGNIYYSKGLPDKAIAEYNKALELDPAHFRSRNNLANVYLMTRRFDMAIDEYKKVLEAQPGNAVVRYNLGLAYEGKAMMREALREWEEAARIDPTFVQANEAVRRVRGY